MRNALSSAVVLMCLACVFAMIPARADDVGLTGPQQANETFVRDYGAAGSYAVGDVVGELRHVARKNDVATTQSVLRTTMKNVTPGAEQSLVSLLTLNGGVLGSAFNILGNKIGIGTSAPARTLDVAGSFAATGNVLLGGVVNNVTSPAIAAKGYQLWTREDARMDGMDINIMKYTYGNRSQQFTWEAGNVGHDFLYRTRDNAIMVDYDRINGTYDAPSPLVDGDAIVAMGASARNSNGTHTPAQFLTVQVMGTPSGATVPMSLTVGTHMNVGVGTTTPKNKLDVEGSAAIGATYSGANAAPSNGLVVEGNVGVGTASPQAKLNVNGNVLVQGGNLMIADLASTPTATAGRSGLFSFLSGGTSELYAIDGAGNTTRLSSHAEPPAGFDPPGADPLPWSMNHANAFIGRGQIVNMSRLVRLVEELTGSDLTYDYDLPADWRLDFETWRAAQVDKLRAEYIQRELDREPRVEVKPEEAVLRAATGNGEQAGPVLKAGYQQDSATGRYYRTRTADDVKAPEIAPPDLPAWIKTRIGAAPADRLKSASASQPSKTVCSPESQAAGDASMVLGGRGNMLAADHAAIVGGSLNAVVADRAAVLAGADNQAAGAESVVLGGHGNKASGAAAVVSGIANQSEADLSFVGGQNLVLAKAARGTFAWGDAPTTRSIQAARAFVIFPAGEGGAAIGTDAVTTGTRLEVAGGDIRISKGSLIVDGKQLAAPDYVFEQGYRLMPPDELRAFIAANRHLPGVPSGGEISQNGLDVSEFQMRLLEKIEELTLYSLAQQERIDKLEKQIEDMKRTR